jgi:hypothetical protein
MNATGSESGLDQVTVGLNTAKGRPWITFLLLFSIAGFVWGIVFGDTLYWHLLGLINIALGVWLTVLHFSVDFRPDVVIDSVGITEVHSNAWFGWNEISSMRLEEVLTDDSVDNIDGKVEHRFIITTEPPSLVRDRTRGVAGPTSRVVGDELQFRLDFLTPAWSEVTAVIETRAGREVPIVRTDAPATRNRVEGGAATAVIGVAALTLAIVAFVETWNPLIGLGLAFLALYCGSSVRSHWRRRRFAQRPAAG